MPTEIWGAYCRKDNLFAKVNCIKFDETIYRSDVSEKYQFVIVTFQIEEDIFNNFESETIFEVPFFYEQISLQYFNVNELKKYILESESLYLYVNNFSSSFDFGFNKLYFHSLEYVNEYRMTKWQFLTNYSVIGTKNGVIDMKYYYDVLLNPKNEASRYSYLDVYSNGYFQDKMSEEEVVDVIKNIK